MLLATSSVSAGLRWLAGACGVAFVVLILVWTAWGGGGPWNWNVVEGSDGTSSTSKFQWALWTGAVVAAYLTLWIIRAMSGNPAKLPTIPASLLTATGLTATTMAAAKAITTTQTSGPNPSAVKPNSGLGGLLRDDTGYPDLSKMQLVAWTLIAVGVFVTEVVHQISRGQFNKGLPDIDPALVVLMGLGQAAYLGKKLITTTTPILGSLNPAQGPVGATVEIKGAGFGNQQVGSQVSINGKPVAVAISSWADASVSFALPAADPAGNPLQPGEVVKIGVVVQGQDSANSLPFTVTGAQLTSLSPTSGAAGTLVTISGVGFGIPGAGNEITINGTVIAGLVRGWNSTQVQFVVPANDAGGQPLTSGSTISIGLSTQGQPGANQLPFLVT